MQTLCHLVHGTERLWRLVSTGSWPVLRELPQVSCRLRPPYSNTETGERGRSSSLCGPLNTDAVACTRRLTYRQQSFYRATANSQSASPEPQLSENTQQGAFKLLVTTASTNQYITSFSALFCLKTPYLIYIVDSSTLNSWPTALLLVLERSLSNTCVYSMRHITAHQTALQF